MDEQRERRVRNLQVDDNFSSFPGQEGSVPADRVLSAVANEHRRAVLESLRSASENTLDCDTLVDHVADRVRDADGERVSDEHRRRVQIELHHNHLPKLEEVQLIDYERETDHIQFAGGELARELLTLVESYDTGE